MAEKKRYHKGKVGIKGIICLAILLVLTGCSGALGGRKEELPPEETGPDAFDLALLQETVPLKEALPEIRDAAVFDNKLQVGKTIVTLPCSYAEIINAGAQPVYTPAELEEIYLDPRTNGVLPFTIDSSLFELKFSNTTEEKIHISQGVVTSTFSSTDAGVIYPKGVAVTSTFSQLIKAWGRPISQEKKPSGEVAFVYTEYPVSYGRAYPFALEIGVDKDDYFSGNGRQYTVTLNESQSHITNIRGEWISKEEMSQHDTISEVIHFEDGSQTRITYQIPQQLNRRRVNLGGTCMTGFVLEGVEYVMVLDANQQGYPNVGDDMIASFFENEINYKRRKKEKYEVEVVKLNEKEGAGVGFYYDPEGILQASVAYISPLHKYPTNRHRLLTVDPEAEIGLEAEAYFKNIIRLYAFSFTEEEV